MAKKTAEKDVIVKKKTKTKPNNSNQRAAEKKEIKKKISPKVNVKKDTVKETNPTVKANTKIVKKTTSKTNTKKETVNKTTLKSKSVDSSQNEEISFLDNFNWHNYEEGIDVIDEKQLIEFEKLVKENFVDTSDEDVIQGTVVYMTDREAIIDINAKSEGVISLNEFRYNPDLKVGDKVEVIVDTREDRTGQLVLSHRKARIIKAWDRVNNAHDNSDACPGYVIN